MDFASLRNTLADKTEDAAWAVLDGVDEGLDTLADRYGHITKKLCAKLSDERIEVLIRTHIQRIVVLSLSIATGKLGNRLVKDRTLKPWARKYSVALLALPLTAIGALMIERRRREYDEHHQRVQALLLSVKDDPEALEKVLNASRELDELRHAWEQYRDQITEFSPSLAAYFEDFLDSASAT